LEILSNRSCLIRFDDVVEESVSGRDLDSRVDALFAFEVFDDEAIVRFRNLQMKT